MGIVGIDLIRFEDRLTDVYEGYEAICLLTAESKYVPSSYVTVLLSRFNDLFEVILSDAVFERVVSSRSNQSRI